MHMNTHKVVSFAVLAALIVSVFPSFAMAAPTLSCSPAIQYANSGQRVSFVASYDYIDSSYPYYQLTWTAVGGYPSSGIGTNFSTTFYTGSINAINGITVTDGYQTATCSVYLNGQTPTPTPYQMLSSTPAYAYTTSGNSVTFTAVGGNGYYSWNAASGYPSSGTGQTFTTTFYNYGSSATTYPVTVWSNGMSATSNAYVSPTYVTPTPTPYQTLSCTPVSAYVASGVNATFTAIGGNGYYSWNTTDGYPISGTGSTFSTRFYNSSSYTNTHPVTVWSNGMSATCNAYVSSTYVTPTPTPTTTNQLSARMNGRNISRGQSAEYRTIGACGSNTVDFLIHLTSTSGTRLHNVYVVDYLPAGFSYLSGSTGVNGYRVGDGITSSGINVGSLAPGQEIVIRFSARVELASYPSCTTNRLTVYNTMQARADGVGTISTSIPVVIGSQNAFGSISPVQTGPADTIAISTLLAVLVAGGYLLYARTGAFKNRMALAEISRIAQKNTLNFSR